MKAFMKSYPNTMTDRKLLRKTFVSKISFSNFHSKYAEFDYIVHYTLYSVLYTIHFTPHTIHYTSVRGKCGLIYR